MKANPKKKTTAFYVVFVLFVLYAVTLILPFLWAFMNTFKTEMEFINNKRIFRKLSIGQIISMLFARCPRETRICL